jgi:hypothetical protein
MICETWGIAVVVAFDDAVLDRSRYCTFAGFGTPVLYCTDLVAKIPS